MAKLYPHKQTVIIFIVCVTVVGIVIWNSHSQSKEQDINITEKPLNNTNIPVTSRVSTDWQKQFFDSTNNSVKLSAKKIDTTSEAPLSMTSEFGRNLFTQYVNLKQTGLTSDTDIVNSTISGVINQAFAESDEPKTYTVSDIITNEDNSAATLKEYGNNIGMLFLKYAPTQDDATLALAGMQGKDPSYKEKINTNINKYKIILSNILKIPAPKIVKDYHLTLSNGMSNMIFIASSLQTSETDPLKAINALKLYSTVYPSILDSIAHIKIALGSIGITYNEGEGGSFFKLTKI
jgi:hypothetical protein